MLDTEIVDLIEDEGSLAEEIEQADGYKETLHECILKLDRFLKATPPTPDASAPTVAAATPPTNVRVNRIRLPFNEDLTRWTAFWESFESAVHNNFKLSEVEKFQLPTREVSTRSCVRSSPNYCKL